MGSNLFPLDFNGDGLLDTLSVDSGSYNEAPATFQFDSTGTYHERIDVHQNQPRITAPYTRVNYGSVDSGGAYKLGLTERSINTPVEHFTQFYKSDKSKFMDAYGPHMLAREVAMASYLIGDFNGDDKDDLYVAAGSKSILYQDGDPLQVKDYDRVVFHDANGQVRTELAPFMFREGYYGDYSNNIPNEGQSLQKRREDLAMLRVGDFNCDGYADIYRFNKSGNSPSVDAIYYYDPESTGMRHGIHYRWSEGLGLNTSIRQEFNETDSPYNPVGIQRDLSRFKFGDFNGDGCTDIYEMVGYNSTVPDVIHMNRGDGKFSSVVPNFPTHISGPENHVAYDHNVGRDVRYHLAHARFDIESLRVGDFNADGLDDVYVFRSERQSSGHNYKVADTLDSLYLSRGDGTFVEMDGYATNVFAPYGATTGNPARPMTAASGSNSLGTFRFTDVDQDGDLDMYIIDDRWYNNTHKSDQIIQNVFGQAVLASVAVQNGPVVRPKYDVVRSGSDPRANRMAVTSYDTTRMSYQPSTNKMVSTVLETTFNYGTALYDREYGHLGFDTVERVTTANGVNYQKSNIFFYQDKYRPGMEKSRKDYVRDGNAWKLVHWATHELAVKKLPALDSYSFRIESGAVPGNLVVDYAFTGQVKAKTETVHSYDDFGNIKSQNVSEYDGSSTSTNLAFANASDAYYRLPSSRSVIAKNWKGEFDLDTQEYEYYPTTLRTRKRTTYFFDTDNKVIRENGVDVANVEVYAYDDPFGRITSKTLKPFGQNPAISTFSFSGNNCDGQRFLW